MKFGAYLTNFRRIREFAPAFFLILQPQHNCVAYDNIIYKVVRKILRVYDAGLPPPDKWSVFARSMVNEISKLGVDSIPLVIIISIFIGAVITIRMTINIVSPLIPSYSTGLATRRDTAP